jgi:hypothetical protein
VKLSLSAEATRYVSHREMPQGNHFTSHRHAGSGRSVQRRDFAAGGEGAESSRTEHAAAEAKRLHGALRVHVLHESDLCGVTCVA